jgi:hypothetical protein
MWLAFGLVSCKKDLDLPLVVLARCVKCGLIDGRLA